MQGLRIRMTQAALTSHIESRVLQNHLQHLMGLEDSHSKLEENNLYDLKSLVI